MKFTLKVDPKEQFVKLVLLNPGEDARSLQRYWAAIDYWIATSFEAHITDKYYGPCTASLTHDGEVIDIRIGDDRIGFPDHEVLSPFLADLNRISAVLDVCTIAIASHTKAIRY